MTTELTGPGASASTSSATASAGAPARPDGSTAPARTGAEPAIARRAFRQVWIGATVCAVAFGATVAATAISYVASFPTEASRQQIAATTSGDQGLAVLLGPIGSIDTVGGYTVYKLFVFLTTVGAIWALLAGTRLLRGEEDAGRWQLVLAGATRPARATAATLVALLVAIGIVFVGTTVGTLLAGRDPDVGFGVGDSVLYGLSLVVAPLVFAMVGAVTSQLARSRRLATGLGMAVFAVAFVLRMLADAGPGTAWLRWTTPFGWVELMEPFTGNDLRPLLLALVVVVALGVAALQLAARRDVGDGWIASRDVAPMRTRGLGSALGLATRLELPVLAAWCVGAAAGAAALGVVAKLTVTSSVPDSLGNTLDKFGVQGSFATQYFGVAFLLVATVVALLPASQVGAAAAEQTSGRSVHTLTGRTSRTWWFAGRLGLAAAGVVVAGVVSGVCAWSGARSQGVPLGFGSLFLAGVNVVPTALAALGIGAVVLAVAPRAASGAVYVVVVWSVTVDLVGSLVSGAEWLDRLSLFHTMALAPAEDPVPSTLLWTTGVALLLCVAATLVFDRRDAQLG